MKHGFSYKGKYCNVKKLLISAGVLDRKTFRGHSAHQVCKTPRQLSESVLKHSLYIDYLIEHILWSMIEKVVFFTLSAWMFCGWLLIAWRDCFVADCFVPDCFVVTVCVWLFVPDILMSYCLCLLVLWLTVLCLTLMWLSVLCLTGCACLFCAWLFCGWLFCGWLFCGWLFCGWLLMPDC